MTILTRRSLLRGLVATPAVVAVSSLMPVRGIVMPTMSVLDHSSRMRIVLTPFETGLAREMIFERMIRPHIAPPRSPSLAATSPLLPPSQSPHLHDTLDQIRGTS